ncbi:MAG TPA: hypothetical protein VFR70_07520, partial [Flavobacterium sp.]|nr:hypothetical protein [Flavobacterium sp.]
MKKLILCCALMAGMLAAYGQNGPVKEEYSLSPDGLFDKVFDHYGNSYRLSDISIGQEVRDKNGQLLRATSPVPVACGYYNLYFETGSGMENASDPVHMARRNVVCQVLSDLSAFINSPLASNGFNNKVSLWVRNINNVIAPPDSPSGVLGLASSFYTMPYSSAAGFGGIADNEIWKTIHLGKDSYTGVVSPLTSAGISSGGSGAFYHGMMAFNFSDPAISWNTNLAAASFPNAYDLYSVVLHEMTHALGFASLINSGGTSKFNAGYNYFSRYDAQLKNSAGSQFLIKKQASACGSMYNYAFNNLLNIGILQPSPNSCSDKIRYVGFSDVPVHTPAPFSPPSSLSHFEGACVSPNPGFAMEAAIGTNVLRRYLKPQERNVLGDLGYSANTAYGASTTYQGTASYANSLSGINVAGANDGIDNASGQFIYSGNAGANINIAGLLGNDINAASFECLEDVFDATAQLTAGNNTATFSSSVQGLHLLRYVPVSAQGTRGNITYAYVYVNELNSCASPTACDLVLNGNFEQYSQLPDELSQVNYACGWKNANNATPDYLHGDSPSTFLQIPCNFNGYQNDKIPGNKAYMGMYIRKGSTSPVQPFYYYESVRTVLKAPLAPSTNYQLSFDISSADKFAINAYKIQAYLSKTLIPLSGYGDIPVADSSMLFENNEYSKDTDGWQKVVFNFSTDGTGGQKFLYIGGLSNPQLLGDAHPVINSVAGCFANNFITHLQTASSYYYIDNVSLMPLDGTFNLPQNICSNQSINLAGYLNAVPFNGTFSGTGVAGNTFNASAAGIGNHTIIYTYANSSGCPVNIYSQIGVLPSGSP